MTPDVSPRGGDSPDDMLTGGGARDERAAIRRRSVLRGLRGQPGRPARGARPARRAARAGRRRRRRALRRSATATGASCSARERIELLLDRDAPFLELSTARGVGHRVHRRRQRRHRHRRGLRRRVRGHRARPDRARRRDEPVHAARRPCARWRSRAMNRLPVINLVESGGADLPTQADLFVPAGQIFHDLTELSALAIPTIALVFGNSTAGGAYVPGMCDYAVLVDRAGQGVPRRAAAGEDGHRRGRRRRGARRRRDALPGLGPVRLLRRRRARRASASAARSSPQLNWRKLGPGPDACPPTSRSTTPTSCSASLPVDLKVPFDPREVLARVVDGSRFDEYKPLYGTTLVTGWASIHGYPVGILANAPRRAVQRGGQEGHRVHPAAPTRPTRRWCSCRTPPATWSATTTSRAGSSRTAPR